MERFFYPESVAVIRVSERPDNLAANIIGNMVAFGYQGDIHAVGLRAGEVEGIPILTSVAALPEDVDLAVILTPAATVPDLLEACGRKGIRRAVIESGGFTEIEGAVRALAASRDRHARPARLGPLPPPPTQRPEKVEALLSGVGLLTTDTALDLCGAFDIPVAPWAAVEDAEAASFAASVMGYPVALKGLATEVAHKSDAGLVALGIADAKDLRTAFAEVWTALGRHAPQAQARRVMVQPMLSRGHEVIIGGKRDPSFGPVVMFGLGGVYVEILEAVAFRLAPLAPEDAEKMVDDVRGSRLLQGVRGQPPADRGAIIEALLGMSRLLVECPEIVEIDVNPLLVFEHGAAAIDARAVIERQRT